ncbi:MAG: hypothetical protein C4576_05060 [Desulfobacteraceae bacterium]|nr:MAG: hypothetical protein C4576_05060 [Desulfobacteraceae bacterium]
MRISPSDLQRMFHPESIAFIGVSRSGYRFGGLSFLSKYLEAGYQGRLYPINPKAIEVLGVKAFPSLEALPEVPDLTMLALPASKVPEILEACGRFGIRHVHVLTSGFSEMNTEEGKALEAQVVSICRRHEILLIGPNCMGAYSPAARLTAWGAIPGLPGTLGIISQSGGMTQRITEYTASLGLGVGKAISFGNGAVLNAVDFLEAFGQDDSIRVIGMYLEGMQDGRGFLETAGRVGRRKPIVLLMGGVTSPGARTAASHTGAMAGNRDLTRAAMRQANIIQVESVDELVDGLLAMSLIPRPETGGVFLIGGGGGNSVVHGDTCARQGLTVPSLSDGSMAMLRKIVPAAGSIAGNPLDFWMTYTDAACLGELIDMAEEDPSISIVLADRLITRKAYHMPDSDPTPETIGYLKGRRGKKPVVLVVDSEGGDPELASKGANLRAAYGNAGYAAFPTVLRAAKALSGLCRYYERVMSKRHAEPDNPQP